MNKLRAKLKKQGGFTLVEMLIVVAIIAILIAVSIPLVANALDKTKHATDSANERSAKAEMLIQYLADTDAVIDDATGTAIEEDTVYYYDAANGKLLTGTPTQTYGQHTGHDNGYIAIKIDSNGQIYMQWASAMSGIDNSTVWNSNLCSGKEVNH